MNNPEYVEINNIKYKINTDYRVALKCQEVSLSDVSIVEKALAIIYLLYGQKGINDKQNHDKLLKLAVKYLNCGEEYQESNEKIDMDFQQDFKLIKASFKSDYNIDISKENIHWWDFYTYLCGLTENSVLNRVRELRNVDTSKIEDREEKQKIEKAQKYYALKTKEKKLTEKQQKSVDKFYELTGIKRKE